MRFNSKSSALKVYMTKEFKNFRNQLFFSNTFNNSFFKNVNILLNRYFMFDSPYAVLTYNNMINGVRKNTFKYHKMSEDIGYFSSIIGKNNKSILILPGGGFENVCTMTEGYTILNRFNELGYNAFICIYQIRDKATYPNPINDIVSIYQDILANYQIDEYGIIGFSAGAHLAATMATKDNGFRKYGLKNPSYVILSYPVITMGKYTHMGTRERIIGTNPSDELIHKYSVEENIDESYPKTYIWHCKDDNIVNSINSVMMSEALNKANVKNKLELFDSTIHGLSLGIGSQAEGWLDRAIEFFNNN